MRLQGIKSNTISEAPLSLSVLLPVYAESKMHDESYGLINGQHASKINMFMVGTWKIFSAAIER